MALFNSGDGFAYVTLLDTLQRIEGSALHDTGNWLSSQPYIPFDAVRYAGALYVCLASNTNTPPSGNVRDNFWSSLVLTNPATVIPSTGSELAQDALIAQANRTAYQAIVTAWTGTAVAAEALAVASQGTSANAAMFVAQQGTAGVNQVLTIVTQATTAGSLYASGLVATEAAARIAADGVLQTEITNLTNSGAGMGYLALQTAWSGTAGVAQAFQLAAAGTNQATFALAAAESGVASAIQIADAGTNLAYLALQTAWSGTTGVAQELVIISQATQAGTIYTDAKVSAEATTRANADSVLQSEIDQLSAGTVVSGQTLLALQTAWAGTALANQALNTAWSGTSGANSALALAVVGTNAAANALAVANQALLGVSGTVYTVPWGGTVFADFSKNSFQKLTLGGSTFFTGTNYTPGASIDMEILSSGSFALSFDSSWKAVSQMPTAITTNATGVLTLACYGSTASQVLSAYAASDFQASSASSATSYGTVPYSTNASGTITYDFAGSSYQETTVNGDLWVTTKNMSPGREIAVVLVPDGNSHVLNFSNFKFFGTTAPPNITTKEIVVAMTSRDTTLAGVKAGPVTAV